MTGVWKGAGILFALTCRVAAAQAQEARPTEAKHDLELHGVGPLAFSPDGKQLAVGGSQDTFPKRCGIVLLLDGSTGKVLQRHAYRRSEGNADNLVTDVTFAPDGKKLAIIDLLGAYIWTPETDTVTDLVRERGFHPLDSVVFSRDGKRLALGSPPGVELWTVGTLKLERFMATDQSGVGRMAFSPDGKWIVTAGADNQILLLDPDRGEALGTIHAEMGPLRDVAVAPDGRSLTVVGEGGVKVWDVGTNSTTPTLEPRAGMRLRHSAAVHFVRYSPDGKFLATSDHGGGLTLWNPATGLPAATLRRPRLRAPVFSPDGKRMAALMEREPQRQQESLPRLLVWKLDELTSPDVVKARAKEDVADLLGLAEAGHLKDAFRQLGSLGPSPETSVPLLVEGLKSPHPAVRQAALLGLRFLGGAAKSAAPEIRKLMESGDDAFRVLAEQALREINAGE